MWINGPTLSHTSCARDDELRARQEAALAECSFRPVTNASSGAPGRSVSASRLPLHERVGEVLRQKSEKLANARISMVRPAQCSASPIRIALASLAPRSV